MSRRILLCALLLVLSLPVAGMAQSADSEFAITTDQSIETPERTVTVDGDEYQVTSVARVRPDDSLTVSLTAPSDASYTLFLYNNDRQIVTTRGMTGDASWTLDASNHAAGSYVVAIYMDGQFKAVQPVVITGYTVDGAPPATVTQGADFETTLDVTSVADADAISSVEVVFMNDDVVRRVNASETGEMQYTATLSATVPPGEYRLYAAVRGDDGYEGRTELLGMSDSQSITVDASTATPTSTDQPADDGNSEGSESNGDSNDDDGSEPADTGDSDDAESTASPDPTTAADTTTTVETTASPSAQPTTTSAPTQTTSDTPTTEAAVTTHTTTSTTPTSSGTVPLDAPQLLLLCTLVGMIALRLRSR